MPAPANSIFLFRFLGVRVYLHYTWALIAVFIAYYAFEGGGPGHRPQALHLALLYYAFLYLGLFSIVILHEFGHALACKSVGGISDVIILYPFGGATQVRPPERAGTTLWTIAAGPLVNLLLVPITFGAVILLRGAVAGTIHGFLSDLAWINLGLLILNMMPVFPLDGGQILRSLLWFIFGRAISLIIAAAIGLVCSVIGAIALLVLGAGFITILLVGFLAMQAYAGLQLGLSMLKMEQAPRRFEVRCPSCLMHPPMMPAWRCACGMRLDTFEHGLRCPGCGAAFNSTACPFCGKDSPSHLWYSAMGSQGPNAHVTAEPVRS